MAIRSRTLILGRQLRAKVGAEADSATRALTDAWVKAWDVLYADMESAVLAAAAFAQANGRWPAARDLTRVDRLYHALVAAQDALVTLSRDAGVTITDAAGRAVQHTVDAEPDLIASQLPAAERAAAAARFAARILPTALDVIVARTATQIHSSTRELAGPAVEAMQRELVRGVALGTGPRQVASKMLAGLEGAFNGGLSRAVTIARTETLDAMRVTSAYAHQANSDVVESWLWLASLGPRCCPACWSKHGNIYPVSTPGPQGHPSCRCARMPVTKSWADLGISVKEPPNTVPDAKATFNALPRAEQLAIMGPGRLAALQSGNADWSDLARRRETPGWRPSYDVTPVRDLAAG